jgi:hypothetical protein
MILMLANDRKSEYVSGDTPSGGVGMDIFYQDARGNPVVKEDAVRCEVVEHDKDNNIIGRMYADLTKSKAK